MKSLRILIVDDHDVVRMGLTTLLSRYPHFQVVAEASNAGQAKSYAQRYQPDVILMDVRLPGKSGIEATREILEIMPDIKILILTSYAQEEQLFDAIRAGATGYVLKRVGSEELIRALEGIARGESTLDPTLIRSVFDRLRETERATEAQAFAVLSQQELRVLALLSKGKSNKEIARILYLSDGTVRNYVSNLMRKLNVESRVEAAVFAIKHHIENHLPAEELSG